MCPAGREQASRRPNSCIMALTRTLQTVYRNPISPQSLRGFFWSTKGIIVDIRNHGTAICRDPVPSPEQRLLIRLVLLAAAGFLLSVSGVLLVRRLMGAFAHPLAPAAMIVFSATITVLVAAVRALWRRISQLDTTSTRGGGLLLNVLLSLGVFCLATSLSLPESGALPLGVFWCIVVAGELVGWSPYYGRLVRGFRTRRSNNRQPDDVTSPTIEVLSHEHSVRTLDENEMTDEEGEDDGFELLPPGVSQRMTRAREENGAEVMYGVLRCDFAAGQRQQNLHVAFCPPLERVPELTTDQIDGPIVRIKPSMVETYGAGLEVKLQAPCNEPTCVQVLFYACEQAVHDAAT